MMNKSQILATWFTRLAVGFSFTGNISCALVYLLQPEKYAPGFEVSGVAGNTIIQGFGILFLMWNVTYPLVILQPNAQKTLFLIILIQQAIGMIGETWLWFELPAGHTALAATGLRFILFDGFGLLLMGIAYGLLRVVGASKR
jgi:hypothetical protein